MAEKQSTALYACIFANFIMNNFANMQPQEQQLFTFFILFFTCNSWIILTFKSLSIKACSIKNLEGCPLIPTEILKIIQELLAMFKYRKNKNVLYGVPCTYMLYSKKNALKPLHSNGGFEWLFINLWKSAAFALRSSENNFKPPENHF